MRVQNKFDKVRKLYYRYLSTVGKNEKNANM